MCGGGGLIAGIAAWYRGKVKVVGVEPELAPTLTKALAAGKPVDAEAGGIAADSLAPKQIGAQVFPIARDHVAEVVLVADDAIRAAQKALWDVLAHRRRARRQRRDRRPALRPLPAEETASESAS